MQPNATRFCLLRVAKTSKSVIFIHIALCVGYVLETVNDGPQMWNPFSPQTDFQPVSGGASVAGKVKMKVGEACCVAPKCLSECVSVFGGSAGRRTLNSGRANRNSCRIRPRNLSGVNDIQLRRPAQSRAQSANLRCTGSSRRNTTDSLPCKHCKHTQS